MLGKVLTISGNAFRETIRQPAFCVVLGVAGALIALSPAFSMFTLLESVKLVQDMGLSTILLAGLLLAVLSASNVVTEEIRGRTALMVVARPVGRGEFVLGKFLGVALALVVAAYLLTLVLVLTVRIGVPEAAYSKLDTPLIWAEVAATVGTLVVAAGMNYFFDRPFPSAVVFSALVLFSLVFFGFGFFDRELKPVPYLSAMHGDTIRACVVLFPPIVVLAAAAVACATRLSLVTSVVGCSLFLVVGMLSDYLFGRLASRSVAAAVPYRVLPNFQVFWMGDALAAEQAVPWSYIGTALGYAGLYTAALVFLAMFLFEAREIQ
jgi:ABC-type transport system involved in multi-copper enzyme maturation permease subunit